MKNKNRFYKKDDYWIMTIKVTDAYKNIFNKDYIEVIFDGDKETVNAIKMSSWNLHKSGNKPYVQTGKYYLTNKKESLNKVVFYGIDIINKTMEMYNEKMPLIRYVCDELCYGKTLDNRRCNLKLVEISENNKNKNKNNGFTKNKFELVQYGDREVVKVWNKSKTSYTYISKDKIDILNKGNISKGSAGYWVIFVEGKSMLLSRYILNIQCSYSHLLQVDHINKNKSDNTNENLLIVTDKSNKANKKPKGYHKIQSGSYQVDYTCYFEYMCKHNKINSVKKPTYKNELDAKLEVDRRIYLANMIRLKFNTYSEYLKFREEVGDENIDDYYIKKYFPNISDINIPI